MNICVDQFFSPAYFKQRYTFKSRTSCDPKEIPSVRLVIPTIAFRDICRNRQHRPVQLVCQIIVPSRKGLCERGDFLSQIHSFLVNIKILENECHLLKIDNRKLIVIENLTSSNLYFRFSIALLDSAPGRIKLGNQDSNLD